MVTTPTKNYFIVRCMLIPRATLARSGKYFIEPDENNNGRPRHICHIGRDNPNRLQKKYDSQKSDQAGHNLVMRTGTF